MTGADATTANGVDVYIKADGELTLTATSADKWGIVNKPEGYRVVGNVIPVKIGA